MWIVDTGDSAKPELISTPGSADITAFLRRDFPGAAIYRGTSDQDFNTVSEHAGATKLVPVAEVHPKLNPDGSPVLDDAGNPVTETFTVDRPELVGNSYRLDAGGSRLELTDPAGTVLATVPLEAVT